MRRNGFTLVELLVIVAIITVLLAMLLPSLKRARAQAMAVRCLAQQRGTGLAFLTYANDYAGVNAGSVDSNGVSWWDNYKPYRTGPAEAQRCTLCWRGGGYGMYSAFGALNANNLDTQFIEYAGHYGYASYIHNMRNRHRADFLLFTCTSAASSGSLMYYGSPPFLANMFWSGGSWNRQGVWLAHPINDVGATAGCFTDGHGELCGPDRLANVPNRRTQDGSYPGGILTWKAADGRCTRDGGDTFY